MDIFWDRTAWEDYQYWLVNDKKILKKINRLIKECQRTPFAGTGKPEPLKENFSGFWSRRITGEHRLVYRVENNVLYIAQCRYHY
ncbi:MAG: Txe/YoeB family addiction module toxin [Bacteroidota bacterium]